MHRGYDYETMILLEKAVQKIKELGVVDLNFLVKTFGRSKPFWSRRLGEIEGIKKIYENVNGKKKVYFVFSG